jgi:putative hydrolase of the HAD superfamily
VTYTALSEDATIIETVLFDCWGTIVQAPNLMRRGASTEIFHRILSSNGFDVDYNAFRDAYIAITRKQNEEARSDWRELDYRARLNLTLKSIDFDEPDIEDAVHKLWVGYFNEWPKQSTLYDETTPLLDALRGNYKLGLVTNYPDSHTAREVFRKFGFEEIFDSLVISAEVGFRKPSRIIFERALFELDASPESTVMVGDTFTADVVGPKEMGMKTILIDTDSSQVENHLIPDAVVRSIGEVGDALKRL